MTYFVIFRRLFGRVNESWMLDMSLGAFQRDFEPMSNEEYKDMIMERRRRSWKME